MPKKHPKKKCPHCHQWFTPNPKTAFRQKYCARPRCKRASKAKSQKCYKSKPEYRSSIDREKEKTRVKRWRAGKPKHWKHVFARFHKGKIVLRRDDRRNTPQLIAW